ncbi:hypothetical protein Trydic_g13147 [Trypoxylus dichotomus]
MPECLCSVEYVWIDGTGEHLRSKARTLEYIPDNHKEVPPWGCDSNASMLPVPKETDVLLVPVAMYNDPFRRSNNKLVLCDTYEFDGKPLPTNNRKSCCEALNKVCDQEIMWGLEQQYMVMDMDERPYGWPVCLGEPRRHKGYYCAVGGDKVFARELSESHYRACLYAGVQIASTHPDAVPGQWEFQIGVSPGIKGPDDLWMARYILARISEEYGLYTCLHPKRFDNMPGCSCHVNFSTKVTRKDNGLSTLEGYMQKLSKRHEEHLRKYDPYGGQQNKLRLTGKDGTSAVDNFTSGVGDKSLSVRITKETETKKKGYIEDRRPASNSDPYAVCDMVVRTCLLDEC